MFLDELLNNSRVEISCIFYDVCFISSFYQKSSGCLHTFIDSHLTCASCCLNEIDQFNICTCTLYKVTSAFENTSTYVGIVNQLPNSVRAVKTSPLEMTLLNSLNLPVVSKHFVSYVLLSKKHNVILSKTYDTSVKIACVPPSSSHHSLSVLHLRNILQQFSIGTPKIQIPLQPNQKRLSQPGKHHIETHAEHSTSETQKLFNTAANNLDESHFEKSPFINSASVETCCPCHKYHSLATSDLNTKCYLCPKYKIQIVNIFKEWLSLIAMLLASIRGKVLLD